MLTKKSNAQKLIEYELVDKLSEVDRLKYLDKNNQLSEMQEVLLDVYKKYETIEKQDVIMNHRKRLNIQSKFSSNLLAHYLNNPSEKFLTKKRLLDLHCQHIENNKSSKAKLSRRIERKRQLTEQKKKIKEFKKKLRKEKEKIVKP